MHYWRSKSMQLLSLPSACANCEAPLRNLAMEGDHSKPEENPFMFDDHPFGQDFDYLKNMAEHVRIKKIKKNLYHYSKLFVNQL